VVAALSPQRARAAGSTWSDDMKLTRFGWLAMVPLGLFACATGVKNVGGGGGGAGGEDGADEAATTSATTSATTASTSGTGGGPCVSASDCDFIDDACNDGTCINGACEKTPANDFAACDDGKECTTNDSCESGVCSGSPKFCPASDACHVGSCDVATDTCVEVAGNDGASCTDDDPCTLSGSCSGGACVPGAMTDCSFLDGPCSIGSCDPDIGCLATPKNDGASCDDGLYCTVLDQCESGICAGQPNNCAAPGDVCMVGVCNEATKTCVAAPGNDGAACDDGNDCTVNEACSSGVCAGGVPGNNGLACDDGDGCTSATTCSNGTCGSPGATITQCIDGDMCCPPGCANDDDCLFWQGGVLDNVAASSLTGWTLCYSDTYNVNLQGALAGLLQQCNRSKLLLACGLQNSQTYTLVAMGERGDVTFDTGQASVTHVANGVGWYFNANWSWGFTNGGDQVQLNECDVLGGAHRLCWHTVNGAGGYRCGDAAGLNNDSTWKRAVYHAD
jgi:hypothetical protein